MVVSYLGDWFSFLGVGLEGLVRVGLGAGGGHGLSLEKIPNITTFESCTSHHSQIITSITGQASQKNNLSSKKPPKEHI